MSERTSNQRDREINALLDGELTPDETRRLKQAATADQRLAREIIEAYELQQALERLRPEPAPAALRRSLRRIPREQRPRAFWQRPAWVAVAATVPLLAIGLMLVRPQQPSQADIQRAAAELAVAFEYIDRVSDKTAGRIGQAVGGELQEAVGASVIRAIPNLRNEIEETQA